MILLSFLQGENELFIAAFNSIADGRAFLQNVPGYKFETDEFGGSLFEYETVDPKAFPDYAEIAFGRRLFPITRFMFKDEETADVCWREIPFLPADLGDADDDAEVVIGTTKVDAYVFPNSEVKAYIEQRERGYDEVCSIMDEMGYAVDRAYRGSEDGEAVIYAKKGSKPVYILNYLDPDFAEAVRAEKVREWVIFNLNEK